MRGESRPDQARCSSMWRVDGRLSAGAEMRWRRETGDLRMWGWGGVVIVVWVRCCGHRRSCAVAVTPSRECRCLQKQMQSIRPACHPFILLVFWRRLRDRERLLPPAACFPSISITITNPPSQHSTLGFFTPVESLNEDRSAGLVHSINVQDIQSELYHRNWSDVSTD